MSLQKIRFAIGWMIAATMLSGTFASTTAIAKPQDNDSEMAAIKSIADAGGRVYKISAEDAKREITFALSNKTVSEPELKLASTIGEVIWLNLAGTKVTDDSLKHLAKMPLEKLHLERTGIGDDGLKHLKSLKNLSYLNLYGTKVTDSGLEHLKELKKLKKLYVWKSKVTESGIKKLNESLPELKIIGESKFKPIVKKIEPLDSKDKKKKPKKKDDKKPKDKKAGEQPKPEQKDQPKKEQPADDKKADKKDTSS